MDSLRSFALTLSDKWILDTADDKAYWRRVGIEAARLQSDGCTGVVDYLRWTCLEHDIHYRTHRFISGAPITFKEANYLFRRRIQQSSPLRVFSPVSWIRWAGVSLFGKKAWH